MPVQALKPDYRGERLDAKANFGGANVVYFRWEHHQWFCAGKAFPLPPQMPWADVMAAILPEAFGQHPDFKDINWDEVQWQLDGKAISPRPEQTLEQLGVDHKSSFSFITPSMLKGYQGAGV